MKTADNETNATISDVGMSLMVLVIFIGIMTVVISFYLGDIEKRITAKIETVCTEVKR